MNPGNLIKSSWIVVICISIVGVLRLADPQTQCRWQLNISSIQTVRAAIAGTGNSIGEQLIGVIRQNNYLEHCQGELLYQEGVILQGMGQSAEALDAYRQSRTLSPDHRPQFVFLKEGEVLQNLGRDTEAVSAWRVAAAAPYFATGGTAAFQRGEYSLAKLWFYLATEIDAGSFRAQRGLAATYRMEHDWKQSASAYRKALLINPNDLDANYNLGVVLLELRDLAGAKRQAQTVMTFAPNYIWAYVLIGNAYRLEGNYDESEFWYSQIRQIPGWDGLAFKYLGINAIDQRNGQKAIQFLQQVKPSASPNDQADLHFWLGQAYVLQGRYDLALQELESATHLKPEIATYQLVLANLYKNTGRIEQARFAYQRVLMIEPDNSQAKGGLAELAGRK